MGTIRVPTGAGGASADPAASVDSTGTVAPVESGWFCVFAASAPSASAKARKAADQPRYSATSSGVPHCMKCCSG